MQLTHFILCLKMIHLCRISTEGICGQSGVFKSKCLGTFDFNSKSFLINLKIIHLYMVISCYQLLVVGIKALHARKLQKCKWKSWVFDLGSICLVDYKGQMVVVLLLWIVEFCVGLGEWVSFYRWTTLLKYPDSI